MHVTFRILSPPSSAPRHHLLNSYRILHINVLQFLIIPYISIPSPTSSWIESSSASDVRDKIVSGILLLSNFTASFSLMVQYRLCEVLMAPGIHQKFSLLFYFMSLKLIFSFSLYVLRIRVLVFIFP